MSHVLKKFNHEGRQLPIKKNVEGNGEGEVVAQGKNNAVRLANFCQQDRNLRNIMYLMIFTRPISYLSKQI